MRDIDERRSRINCSVSFRRAGPGGGGDDDDDIKEKFLIYLIMVSMVKSIAILTKVLPDLLA
jgi:hypothetical protein